MPGMTANVKIAAADAHDVLKVSTSRSGSSPRPTS